MLIIYKMTNSYDSNIGNDNSPFPHRIDKLKHFKTASSSGEFDSVNKLNSLALSTAGASKRFPLVGNGWSM